jgi:hypothetical protein
MKARRFGLWLRLLLGGALLLAVWMLLVWVASRPALKTLIDLTPQQVNSVDETTVELLRELRAQQTTIQFHMFYPPLAGQAASPLQQQELVIRSRLRELTRLLLVRYQFLGGDAVEVLAHDFYADAQKTREAAQKFDYRDGETDVLVVAVNQPGKAPRFRKLSLLLDLARIEHPNLGGGPMSGTALPVLKQFLGELQISSALKSLLVEGTPVIYLLREFSSTLSLDARGDGYSELLAALGRSGFEVRDWRTTQSKDVPADAALVLVLEPTQEFPDVVATALYDYVKRGGRVLLNFAWSPVPGHNPDGGKFAELMGYALSPRPVFHLIGGTARTAGRGLDGDQAVAKLALGADSINELHPTTRRWRASGRPLEVAMARQVGVRDGAPAAVRRETLLRSGPAGWLALLDGEGFPDFRAPKIQLKPFDVAMALEVDVTPEAAARPDARKTGQVVVIGGLFCNNAGFAPFGDLALNICNWMAERRVLLDLKTAAYEAKYLALQPEQVANMSWLLHWGVPGLFLVLGFAVWFVRRRQ